MCVCVRERESVCMQFAYTVYVREWMVIGLMHTVCVCVCVCVVSLYPLSTLILSS